MTFTCTIPGEPASKKNGARPWVRGKRTFMIPNKQYVAWEAAAIPVLQSHWDLYCTCFVQHDVKPLVAPVALSATFYRSTKRRFDLSNGISALSDAIAKAGLIKDDFLIRSYDGCRLVLGDPNPRIELELRLMSEVAG